MTDGKLACLQSQTYGASWGFLIPLSSLSAFPVLNLVPQVFAVASVPTCFLVSFESCLLEVSITPRGRRYCVLILFHALEKALASLYTKAVSAWPLLLFADICLQD